MHRPIILIVRHLNDSTGKVEDIAHLKDDGVTDYPTLCGTDPDIFDSHGEIIYEGPGRVTCPQCLAEIQHVFNNYGIKRKP